MLIRFYLRPVLICTRATSSFTPYKPTKEPASPPKPGLIQTVKKRLKNKLIGKIDKENTLSGPSQTPLNFNYPNKKGVQGFEVYTSLEEVKDELPKYVKNQFQTASQEFKDRIIFDNPDFMDSTLGPLHNTATIEYDFKSDEALKRWKTGCDSVWGEGYSTCKLERTDHNTGLFTGHLDTRIIRDGKIERAGWASMKTIDCLAFNRKRYLHHWMNYSHLLIKCRGDGRSYKIMLHSPGHVDLQWFDAHSYPLHTHGGPYWQYERIPFSKFFLTVGGRIQDMQYEVPTFYVSNISIVLMDRIEGKFQLEVDYIGVVHDSTHNERFAYEKYSLPVYTVAGI